MGQPPHPPHRRRSYPFSSLVPSVFWISGDRVQTAPHICPARTPLPKENFLFSLFLLTNKHSLCGVQKVEKESSLFSDGVGREFVSVPRLFRMRKMRAHLVGQPPLSAFQSFLAHRNGGSVAVADWRGEKRLYVFYIDLSKTPESRNRDASASLFLFSGLFYKI